MRLADFIRANKEPIVVEWENFARMLVPTAEGMSPLTLRNHITYILSFIADDIDEEQSPSEQIEKSHGLKPKQSISSAAETHASLRHAGGFNMDQMVSEYRSLRASVIKLWEAQLSALTNFDLTDLTRFNEAVDQAMTESIHHYSNKLEHSQGLFLGIMRHDLRNPLGAIQMSSQLVLKIGTLTDRQTMLVNQISESALRAIEIVTNLLDLTRARLGSGIPIIKSNMDMDFVTRQLVDEMRSMHPDCVINLDISGDMEGNWDRPRMAQVLSNLLGNALQYGFTGLPITVTLKGNENDVVLTVHNFGVPIKPDVIGTIFYSLNRGNAQDDDKPSVSINLGLGLYIVKEIIQAHGGTITVTSSEKNGTLFTATMPRS